MADMTIPQTAPIGLQKAYYTLQEVADRWTEKTGKKVSPGDVLHYEEIGLLRIAALLNNAQLFVRLAGAWNPIARASLVWPSTRCDKTHSREEIEKTYPASREYRREFLDGMMKEDQTRLIREIFYPFTRIEKQLRDGDEIVFSSVYTTEDEAYTTDFMYEVIGMYRLPPMHKESYAHEEIEAKVNRRDLCITLQELHRFEEAHGIGKPAQLPKLHDASEETKVKRLERALGALALGLAQSSTGWRNGETPNISAIASLALKAIKQNEDASRPHGYGETSIYNAISEAIKAVQKD